MAGYIFLRNCIPESINKNSALYFTLRKIFHMYSYSNISENFQKGNCSVPLMGQFDVKTKRSKSRETIPVDQIFSKLFTTYFNY